MRPLACWNALAKTNIPILGLPPHTTHTLQPLDKSVIEPLKRSCNSACAEYMSADPNRLVSKASWPGLFNEAFVASVTNENITSGFRACGIFPFSKDALSQDLFLPSTVTDVTRQPAEEQQSADRRHQCSKSQAVQYLGLSSRKNLSLWLPKSLKSKILT